MSHLDSELNPTTRRIFLLLDSGVRLSRNRHFELFRDPRARHARRLHRLFKSLCADLNRCSGGATLYSTLTHECSERPYGIHIDIPLLGGKRTVFLTRAELGLLAEYSSHEATETVAALLGHVALNQRTIELDFVG